MPTARQTLLGGEITMDDSVAPDCKQAIFHVNVLL